MKSLLICIFAACAAQAEVYVGVLSPSEKLGVSSGSFYVPARLRPAVKENSNVAIQVVGFPMLILPGTVKYVAPKNDAASGLMQIRIEVQRGTHPLLPGMRLLGAIGN